MLAIDQGTKAYLAGLLDAHGNFVTRRHGGRDRYPVIELSSTNLTLLRFVAGLTDSGVSQIRKPHNTYPSGETPPPGKEWSRSCRWAVSGCKAIVVIHNIRPYLMFQREAALRLLTVAAEEQLQFKYATYRKMYQLGWELPPSAPSMPKEAFSRDLADLERKLQRIADEHDKKDKKNKKDN